MAYRKLAPRMRFANCCAAAAVVLSGFGAAVGGEVLQSKDGLRLEFSEQGRVSRVVVGSTAIPLKGTGGFAVADYQCPPAVVNLVPNPGFEEGVQGWRLEKGQTLDTAVAHGGRASIRLHVPGPRPDTTNLGIVIPVKPYTAYRVGLWYRRHQAPSGKGGAPAVFYSELDDK